MRFRNAFLFVPALSVLLAAPAARLSGGWFDAGTRVSPASEAVTVFLRARDPRGHWNGGLLNKRGNHDVVTFNLFGVPLDGRDSLGFELHAERGFAMARFPVGGIDAGAWHDLVGRYDGRTLDLFCDGTLMAREPFRGGRLTQNSEPVLIGAETDNGKVVRPFAGLVQEAAVWDVALSDAQVSSLSHKEKITLGPGLPEPFHSPIHFRPETGRLGDTIPFFWKGEYHVFYLLATAKVPWEHVVSTDLVHWKELPTALTPEGPADGPDGQNMFTGSVTESGGTFHLYYTAWNPRNPAGREFIGHATSPDLIHWAKHPADRFGPDDAHYANRHDADFRDAYVFRNEAENRWWMVLCANSLKGGGPGLAVSDDLRTWSQVEALQAPNQECPDLFRIGDTWYLIGADTYRHAKDPHGPFTDPPVNNVIDRPAIYAGKRMFDGRRHVWTGWLWDRVPATDAGAKQWGGTQCLPRELYAGPEGQLYCRPVEEVTAAYTKTVLDLSSRPDLHTAPARWAWADGRLSGEAAGGSQCMLDAPPDYMLTATIRLDPAAEFSLVMRESPDLPGSGYRLTLRPRTQEAEIGGPAFKYPRRIELDAGKPVKLQCFVQGSMFECFVNDAYALSCRGYDFKAGRLGLNVTGGKADVQSLTLKTAENP